MNKRQCFLSYSHEDAAHFDMLLPHIKALSNLYDFKIWHDRRLNAGYAWQNSILKEMDKSEIFICVITNEFFSSDYIFNNELPRMGDKANMTQALVMPVVFQECAWRQYFGSYIDLVPKDKKHNLKPVCKWGDKREALGVAANAMSASIEKWFGIKPHDFGHCPLQGARP
jgi:hypothetical protein